MKSLIFKPEPNLAMTWQLSHSAPPPSLVLSGAVDPQAASIELRKNTHGFSSLLQKKNNTKAGLSTPFLSSTEPPTYHSSRRNNPGAPPWLLSEQTSFKWGLLWLPCQRCQQSVTLTTSWLKCRKGGKATWDMFSEYPWPTTDQCWYLGTATPVFRAMSIVLSQRLLRFASAHDEAKFTLSAIQQTEATTFYQNRKVICNEEKHSSFTKYHWGERSIFLKFILTNLQYLKTSLMYQK